MMHKRRIHVFAVVVVLVLSSLACSIGGQSDKGGTRSTVQAPGDTGTRATPTPAPTATHTPIPTPTSPPAESTEDKDPLELAEIPEPKIPSLDPRGVPLTQLGTFRQRMTAEFNADDGTFSAVYHYDAEVNTEDKAVYVKVAAEGTAFAVNLPVKCDLRYG